ncbi:hypothetical protein ABT404_15445 [Streptomyces hyaluromycini]|uniref:Uncharacterized protein n=1 Tax=Streptomyces hyaluromycini TaxID=1377993 RepID=A0ABV1WVT1_9ACTN
MHRQTLLDHTVHEAGARVRRQDLADPRAVRGQPSSDAGDILSLGMDDAAFGEMLARFVGSMDPAS